ncbi:MAG: hypothetical protein ACREDF_11625, partial [Thermoplasmata archaeon]
GNRVHIPWDLLSGLAQIAVIPIGAWLAKKVRDRDVREAIVHAADAALVLAIQKTKGNGIRNLAELVQIVVEGIKLDPSAPRAVRNNPNAAATAARAAIARNSVGVTQIVNGE